MDPEQEITRLVLKDMEEWLYQKYFKKKTTMYEYLDEVELNEGKQARSEAVEKLTSYYWQNHLGL